MLCISVAGALALLFSGCSSLTPNNGRNWAPDQTRLPTYENVAGEITIHNVRNCRYTSSDDYVVQYYDKQFNLSDVESVDFLVAPFNDTPSVAHTMLSFGFADGDQIVSSVEIRKEADEEYSAWKGFFNQYELMYVIGDERDVINLSSNQYKSDVYLYRTMATPEQSQELLLDVLQRANKLAVKPEFYNTITNNCTTNIVQHVNDLAPERVRYNYKVLFTGYSDEYAYELGLLDQTVPFEELKRRSRINELAEKYEYDPDFSAKIRRR
ncbi:Lnb N-terminal periplasmic domain-containing protein [Blastopirellula retiformator]|uniref:Lnb N-terminal periplasmic domain-containing protein n=1 Tax=Blastopirellula retiformator TaxID=2527970 RepID=A0A5C5V6M1_9BACT|nr:DUF4105 domain-containing protein [Blastopirellula retiformator]TWT34244.1 hypothetical protein Enr8_16380 [Blastopirellula retiformator]